MKTAVHPIVLLAAFVLAGAQGCYGSTTRGSAGSRGASGSAGADAGGTGAGGTGGGTGDAGTSGGAGGSAGSGGVECGTTLCGPGQVCVIETIGEAVGHSCKANPCGTHTLSCTCAASLCEMNDSCSTTPPSTVNCSCASCV